MTRDEVIFNEGSKTYSRAARLFPRTIRDDVTKLYSFVRIADNLVDKQVPDAEEFYRLKKTWIRILKKPHIVRELDRLDTINHVTCNMYDISTKYEFDTHWVNAFLESMEWDITHQTFLTDKQFHKYVYGSAEVIGLMMSRIMGLPHASDDAARAQGRAMQLINFIRDISEDRDRGRTYFSKQTLAKAHLSSLTETELQRKKHCFEEFIWDQLDEYDALQARADKGMLVIPRKYRRALKVAVDGYDWTAGAIRRNPSIVLRRQLKPSKGYLSMRMVWRLLVG